MKKNVHNELGTLQLNGKPIPFVVVRSVNRKRTIAFRINAKQGLVILAPLRTSLNSLKAIAVGNTKWILDKYAVMEQELAAASQRKLITGEFLPYLGSHYSLNINGSYYKPESCCLVDNQLHVSIAANLTEAEHQQQVRSKLIAWYRQQAQQIIKRRLPHWVKISGLQPVNWRITSALRRWGSCSAENHICINWRLILTPVELVDYVIVHELCHIMHKNHSKAFWGLVAKIMPDYKQRRLELKKQTMHFV